jgi:hypothetical protein
METKQAANDGDVTFLNWRRRPAVVTGTHAFAILWAGETWTAVDRSAVMESGAQMSEAAWRLTFEPVFGPLAIDKTSDAIVKPVTGDTKGLRALPAMLAARMSRMARWSSRKRPLSAVAKTGASREPGAAKAAESGAGRLPN